MQLKATTYSFLYICFCYLLVQTACQPTDSKVNTEASRKIFRYNQDSGISSLDPAFAKDQANIWVIHQLFNSLVQTDNELNIKPCIAKSWSVSDDGLTYMFTLRNDVYFHKHELFKEKQERLLTASDVVYSFERLIDPATASTGAWLFNGKLDDNTPFLAVDDTTFQLKLAKPFPPMLSILSMQYCSIIPQKIAVHYGKAFRKNPVGTGAFVFKYWKEGDALILSANPNYFETDAAGKPLPYIDGIRISFMESKRNAFLKFIQGELDFLSGIDATYKDDLLTKEGELLASLKDSIRLQRSAYLNTEYLGFLLEGNTNPALQDVRVRQAINYGFNRQKMVKFLRNNIGIPATSGFVPPGLPSYSKQAVNGYSYNQQKAQQLLAEAGYPSGKGLPAITLETTAAYKDLCTFIQQELSQIGITINIELNPSALLRDKVAKGKVNFFRASWIGDYPDAETYLAVLYGGNPAPPNYTRFSNKAYDTLYKKAINTNNTSARYQLYQQMDSIAIAKAVMVPLYYDEVLRFSQKNIDNLGINAINLLTLKEVKID